MSRRAPPAAWLLLGLAAASGGLAARTAAEGVDPMTLELRSPAFTEGGEVPARHTCEGRDLSPPLVWTGAPEGTRSLVLIVGDPDAPTKAEVERAMQGHVLAQAELVGTYEKRGR